MLPTVLLFSGHCEFLGGLQGPGLRSLPPPLAFPAFCFSTPGVDLVLLLLLFCCCVFFSGADFERYYSESSAGVHVSDIETYFQPGLPSTPSFSSQRKQSIQSPAIAPAGSSRAEPQRILAETLESGRGWGTEMVTSWGYFVWRV